MRSKKTLALALLTTLVLAIAVIPAYAASAKPSLSRTEMTLYAGRSKTIKAKGFLGSVAWKSSNAKVATVSAKGKVTARRAGTATITAKCGKQKKTCKVTVKPVKLSKTKASVTEGKTLTLKLYCGASSGIEWKTSKGGVVRIKSKSKNSVTLKALSPGKATIIATYRKKTYKCVVTVKKKGGQGGSQTPTPTEPDPGAGSQGGTGDVETPEVPLL